MGEMGSAVASFFLSSLSKGGGVDLLAGAMGNENWLNPGLGPLTGHPPSWMVYKLKVIR